MSPIPLTDKDGSDPLSICRVQREWLVSRYRDAESIALRYFSNDLPIADRDRATDEKAVDHIRKCPRCREWFHQVVPDDVLRRQSRLVRYCCASMFVAVEEADLYPSMPKISFELFRNEDPCWKIDDRYGFISFCPWCGKKLPDQPFITDP